MENEVVEIHRSRQADNYTIIPNDVIRDVRLSRFTRSLLIEILSNTPGWHATADSMWGRAAKTGPAYPGEGRDVHRRAFRQLEAAGYLVRTKVHGPGGKWITHLHFYDTPPVSPGQPSDGISVAGPTCDDTVSAGETSDCDPAPGATSQNDVSPGGSEDWISANASQNPGPEFQASSKRTTFEEKSSTKTSRSGRPKRDRNAGREDARRLCEHLADRIEGNGNLRPTITKEWLDAARLMLDNDHRRLDQAHRAIDWCQGNEFWRRNILSMPKLREQYDRLRMQAEDEREQFRGAGGSNGRPTSASGPDRARGWMAAGRVHREAAKQAGRELPHG